MTPPVQLEHRDGSPVVRLVGDVGMQAVAACANELYRHTRDHVVVVDLADVASLDGPGLTVLLMTLRAAQSVRLIHVPPAVRELANVSGSAEVLEFDAA